MILAIQNVGFGLAVWLAGALSDTTSKTRLLLIGSLILGFGFLAYYVSPLFGVNLVVMFFIGIGLKGRVFGPDFTDLFTVLKFIADAGSGLLYWIALVQGIGPGEPTAYTYDFGNVFIYSAGLLNMLVVVDAFDIAKGRKP